MFRQYRFRNYNFRLVIFVIALGLIGYLAVGSAQESLRQRQMFGIVLGIGLMLFLSFADYSVYRYMYWIFYVFNIVLLALVLSPLGVEVNGSKRWINIGFQFQPSELAKILLILFFAQFIMKYKDKINSPRILVTLVLLLAVPLYLVYKEPDLSTSIMIIVTFCVMVFVGGLSYKIVFALLAVLIPAVVAFFAIILKPDAEETILHGYQVTRILAWLEPEKYADSTAYQQLNSITAIGSGQLFGKGLDNNVIASVKNGNFISEPQTDFIFAIVGEELGFVGSAGVVILVLLIVWECLLIARNAKDLAGSLIASGVAGLIGLQAFLNIAVATGLAPNTGIPLPFVSYGLTSLVSLFGAIGIVINIGLQSKKH
ncbi:MAG: rod shape-determining protein RodA [Lachnospiraceae bacterium]|nr:rod shape-determining protein RodA [Lachnospiraceae bacterium]